MSDRLPPLTALRAFEAAARHMSFAKAAKELNVTPAALSFQIKSLEEHLGAPVFRRLNRAVELTEAGECLAPGTSDAFATLGQAWLSTRRLQEASVLNVTAGPAFTAKWLAPRLYDFAQKHPGIELRLAASLRIMEFGRDDIDVAIRFGEGHDDGLFVHPFGREWVTPVMTPEWAAQLKNPGDLLSAPLLHDDSIGFLRPKCDWTAWLCAAGVTGTAPGGTRFSQADHAIDAALSGAGVALGRLTLAAQDLIRGRLVAPFDIALRSQGQFRLLCPKGHEARPAMTSFLGWVQSEIEKTRFLADGFRCPEDK